MSPPPTTTWFPIRAQYPIFSLPIEVPTPHRPVGKRKPPIHLAPLAPPSDISKSAVVIFIHSLYDDAEGVEPVVRQLQAATNQPHIAWNIPNATEGDYLTLAWFAPRRLTCTRPSRPEEEYEDEVGLMMSVGYVESLIDQIVATGVPANRIVLGGFSQGHAVALLTGLVSKYAGKLAGLFGMAGYVPLAGKIAQLRMEAGLPEKTDNNVAMFLLRGSRDTIVPQRYVTLYSKVLKDIGVKPENSLIREYEGLGHAIRSDEIEHIGQWLEQVVPPLECIRSEGPSEQTTIDPALLDKSAEE
ncbi:unnamed protein product [Periconia digitata]|uniref:Acyl-protein thioesterase 1 n=1 Tax=Periconia digitata TaxID=1303443 RepID=A0A9W4UP58_9PLEO|nr:unnamed protein product [Periconia digitata]